MEIQLERFGKVFSMVTPTVDDMAQRQKAQHKTEALSVAESSAGAAEKVGFDVENDLNRNDDIGKMFSAYGYAAPPMPLFES